MMGLKTMTAAAPILDAGGDMQEQVTLAVSNNSNLQKRKKKPHFFFSFWPFLSW